MKSPQSLPTRERELKHARVSGSLLSSAVAPYTGA